MEREPSPGGGAAAIRPVRAAGPPGRRAAIRSIRSIRRAAGPPGALDPRDPPGRQGGRVAGCPVYRD